MSRVNDGGAFHPTFQQYVGPDEYTYLEPQGGLTVRQFYAAAAIQGISANPDLSRHFAEAGLKPQEIRDLYASAAWATADALIEQEAKTREGE